jgi:glycosyltransferase involved in cell wall biosynthesis
MSPRVSVIIPCYDMGRYLDEAVESVLLQTCADFEILVVDDGSTDPETQRLLAGYRRPKTRVFRCEHAGVTATRNYGVAQAAGEYLSFVDADDRMGPRCLERCLDRFDADPSLTFVSFWVRLFGEESWDWRQSRCDLLALLGECTVATAALVQRSAVEAVGGFDPAMELGHEDWDLWLSLTERGFVGAIVPEVLFYYRRRSNSRSAVADRGETNLRLFADRVRKHDASYRRFLFDALCEREAQVGSILRAAGASSASQPGPRAESDRPGTAPERAVDSSAELAALREEMVIARARVAALEEACERTHEQLESVLASESWRLTRPGRRVYDFLRGRRNTR